MEIHSNSPKLYYGIKAKVQTALVNSEEEENL